MKLCLVCNFQFSDDQEVCPKDFSKLVPLGKDQLLGKVIQDRYRIESIIAKGSMGVVYKAVQELIGRDVAVKVLHAYLVSDEESLKRFQKEAKAASRLNHPNITTLYDYGVLGSGQPYIVMDLLRGSALSDVLKQRDYLPLDETLVIFRQVCAALSEAHKRGVVHRDIKPENIVLEYGEKGPTVKVVDFGIAKFLQEQDDTIGRITKTGTVCGSPTYMSPEQCDDHEVNHRTDIYSLGVVLYETLTGNVPFSGTDIYNVMTMHVKQPPPSLKQIRPDLEFPPYIEDVLIKCLAKDPNQRYQTVDLLAEALEGRVDRMRGDTLPRTVPARPQPAAAGVSVEVPQTMEQEVQDVVARSLQKRLDDVGSTADAKPVSELTALRQMRAQNQAGAGSGSDSASGSGGAQRPDSIMLKRSRYAPSPWVRLIGLGENVFPILITVLLFGALIWVVANEELIHTVIDNQITPIFKKVPGKSLPERATQDGDVSTLIAQAKYDQAKATLDSHKKAGGKLTGTESEQMNVVCERLARREIKSKHYKQALALLEQISPDGQDDVIKGLIKKYKKQVEK